MPPLFGWFALNKPSFSSFVRMSETAGCVLGGSLHDGFAGSGEHLTLFLLVLLMHHKEATVTVLGVFGGCGGFGR